MNHRIAEEYSLLHAENAKLQQEVAEVKAQLKLTLTNLNAPTLGRRDLPLLPVVQDMLTIRRDIQAADRLELGRAWEDTGLIFSTKTGRPVEPRNLVRSFRRICDHHGLRRIKVHHLRHTTATLLKNLGVPARDAQLILGHSRLAVILEIYTHEDRQAQREALGRISDALGHGGGSGSE
jgi:integrase